MSPDAMSPNAMSTVEALLLANATLLFLLGLGLLCARYPAIRLPLLLGGLLRLAFAFVIGLRLAEIPGTTADAVVFEARARLWSEMPWAALLASFDPAQSFVISWVGAIVYKLFLPSPVLLNLITAALSVGLIVLSYRLAATLWGRDRGRAAAWIVALFPFAVLYGSVFMREVFGSLFFMYALLHAVDWARRHSPVRLVSALVCFGVAGLFHAGYAVGALGLLLFAGVSTLGALARPPGPRMRNIALSGVVALLIGAVALTGLVASGVRLNKIGEVADLDVVAALEHRVAVRVSEGGSSYPGFLVGVDPFASPQVIPGRLVYFLVSPFPWDIRAASHLLGFVATVYFVLMLRSIFAARRIIVNDRAALVVVAAAFLAVLAFAVSVDNIGTSIRHRTKFLYPLAALCAVPLFGRKGRASGRGSGRGVWAWRRHRTG